MTLGLALFLRPQPAAADGNANQMLQGCREFLERNRDLLKELSFAQGFCVGTVEGILF
jgi:hypothetical protein